MNLSVYRKISEYFRHILKNNSKLIVLFTLLLFLVNVGRIIFNPFKTKLENLVQSGLLTTTFLAVVFTVVLAIVLFNYLSNRKQLDLIYNLPIKRTSLLTLNYILGLSILIIYFILGWLMNLIAASIGGFLDWTPFITILIGTIVLIFIVYSMLFFTCINSNNIVDAVILAVALMVVPLIMYAVYYYFKSQFIVSAFNSYTNNAIYSISPLTYYISFTSIFSTQFTNTDYFLALNGELGFTSIMMIVFGFILLISGFFIYKNSKNDSGDKKTLSTVLTFACLLSIQMMILFPIYAQNGLSINFIFYAILPLLLLSIVFILVISYFKKSFDNILRNFVIYFLAGALTIGMFIGIEKVNAFNLLSKPYNIDTVENIYMDKWNDGRFFVGSSNLWQFEDRVSPNVKFENEENIKLIYDYNTNLIDLLFKHEKTNTTSQYNSFPFEYKELFSSDYTDYFNPYPYYYSYYFNIYYTNYFNHTKNANYTLPSSWVYDLITLSNEKSIVKEDLDKYLDSVTTNIILTYTNILGNHNYTNSELDYKLFIDTYFNDLETINVENHDGVSLGYVNVGSVPFLITSNMTETTKLLESKGIVFTKQSVSDDSYLLLPSEYLYSHISFDKRINSDSSTLNLYPVDTIEYIKLTPELFNELSGMLVSSAVYTESTYSIVLKDGFTFLINPENISKVEELISTRGLKTIRDNVHNILEVK